MALVQRRRAGYRGLGLTTVVATVFGTILACAMPAEAAPVDAYLPKSGVLDAKIMVIGSPPQIDEIGDRMQAAILKDRPWFLAYVKQHQNDDVLPYDPRLGISAAEYDQLNHAKLQLKQVGAVKILIKPNAAGAKVLETPPGDKTLAGISIAADGQSAITPAGVLPAAPDIHNTDPDSPTGPWDGASFAVQGDPHNGIPSVLLAFGKRVKEGDGLMYFSLSATSKSPAREAVLLYPMK